jgi:hypothetical protein
MTYMGNHLSDDMIYQDLKEFYFGDVCVNYYSILELNNVTLA